MNINATLNRRIAAYAYRRRKLQSKINLLAGCRLVVFVLVVFGFSLCFGGAYRLQGATLFLTSLAAFLFLMVLQDRCYHFKVRIVLVARLLADDLARAEWRFDDLLENRSISFEDDHPFAHDLDLSGQISVLKLLDNCYHDRARALLKCWIDRPSSVADIESRQQCVADLTERRRFRLQLALATRLNSDVDLSPDMFHDWMAQTLPWSLKWPAYILGRMLSLLTTVILILHFFFSLDLPYLSWLPLLLLQLSVFYCFDRIHGRFNLAFMQKGKAVRAVCEAIATLEKSPVHAVRLKQIKASLLVRGKKAGARLKELSYLHEMLSYRSNGFAHFLLNGLLMWDQHYLRKLASWRDHYGPYLKVWVEGIFEVEALAAMANYRQLFPGRPFALLKPDESIFLETSGMGHPSIADKERVVNDYKMPDSGRLHLITGSNMSGKSTFLRTVGVNLVLARLGAPVCAKSFTSSLFRLWTSIHIQDSLAQGVSYFYAEVQRIKSILVEVATEGQPVFYLMDEILKGTNSRERLIATKAMVHYLLDHGASGLITTHDLELLAIKAKHPQHIINFHFQEDVAGDEMFFDYRLKQGELTSTNALRVMRHAGVPLIFED